MSQLPWRNASFCDVTHALYLVEQHSDYIDVERYKLKRFPQALSKQGGCVATQNGALKTHTSKEVQSVLCS